MIIPDLGCAWTTSVVKVWKQRVGQRSRGGRHFGQFNFGRWRTGGIETRFIYEYLVNNNVASLKTYVVRQHVHLNRDAKECTGVVYLKWSSPGAERTRANPTDDFARVINCSRRYRTPIIAEGLPVFTDGTNTAPLDVLLLDTRTSRVLYLALLDQGHCVQMDHY